MAAAANGGDEDGAAASPREDTGKLGSRGQRSPPSGSPERNGGGGTATPPDRCAVRLEFQCAAGGAGRHCVDFGYVFASGGYRCRGDRDRLNDDGAIEVLLNGRNVALVRVGKGDAGSNGAAAPVSVGTINPYTNP